MMPQTTLSSPRARLQTTGRRILILAGRVSLLLLWLVALHGLTFASIIGLLGDQLGWYRLVTPTELYQAALGWRQVGVCLVLVLGGFHLALGRCPAWLRDLRACWRTREEHP